MNRVLSRDGTTIAYDISGEGRPVILVDGALCYRSFGPMPRLAALLAPHFTVLTYDRRGRGDSGDLHPYTVEREVEDLEALIDEAGGSAALFGVSSGASLALETAIRLGGKVEMLAMYEPPYNADKADPPRWADYRTRLSGFLAQDRRGDAAALFMTFAGTPAEQIEGMRQAPMWQQFEDLAPTLIYDADVIGRERSVPTARAARITAPALVMNGGAGVQFMRDTARALARAIPGAGYRELEGQTHAVDVDVLAPVLIEALQGADRRLREAGRRSAA